MRRLCKSETKKIISSVISIISIQFNDPRRWLWQPGTKRGKNNAERN